jgi:hypothetical protein
VKQIPILATLAAAATVAGGALAFSAAGADDQGAQIFDGKLPPGYRDWRLISVAHEEGGLNDLRAVLGNDIAIKAYRAGKTPFPDGAVIARLAWAYVPSAENDKAFGRAQSFVAGAPTNVQFMVKDARRYAATGGWGFAQFNAGKPAPRGEGLLRLPCAGEGAGLCVHALCALSDGRIAWSDDA